MSTHQIHVFISHAWNYTGNYDTLADWIFGQKWSVGQASLNFRDFSVPRNDPIHDAHDVDALKEAIYSQIGRSHVIAIPTGMYATRSTWIRREIDGAKNYEKPFLAVTPWAQEKASSIVKATANRAVGWNKKSVVNGIWHLFRDGT